SERLPALSGCAAAPQPSATPSAGSRSVCPDWHFPGRQKGRDRDLACTKRTGRPRKTSKRQDKQLKAICLENRKSTTKQMKHTWEEAGANVCDRTVRNRLKEMGFQYRKAKRKPSLTPKHKRTRLQWAKERQSWTVDDWMKVIFSDESRICIGQGFNLLQLQLIKFCIDIHI
uniref:Transposase Tc1-like domain-containing protein n=1 Tax=Astyanax mexicanus TaxID=7994 RepID=A0A3B1IMH6_ASTMX